MYICLTECLNYTVVSTKRHLHEITMWHVMMRSKSQEEERTQQGKKVIRQKGENLYDSVIPPGTDGTEIGACMWMMEETRGVNEVLCSDTNMSERSKRRGGHKWIYIIQITKAPGEDRSGVMLSNEREAEHLYSGLNSLTVVRHVCLFFRTIRFKYVFSSIKKKGKMTKKKLTCSGQ